MDANDTKNWKGNYNAKFRDLIGKTLIGIQGKIGLAVVLLVFGIAQFT